MFTFAPHPPPSPTDAHARGERCGVRGVGKPEGSSRQPQLIWCERGLAHLHAPHLEAVLPPGFALWLPAGVQHHWSSPTEAVLHRVHLAQEANTTVDVQVLRAPPLMVEMVQHATRWGSRPPEGEASRSFFEALSGLIPRWNRAPLPLQLPLAAAEDLQRGLVWLRQRLGRPVGPLDAARHAELSLRTFQRRCREEVGMTPSDWLQRARVLAALGLLLDETLPISEVALRCGYQSQASFSRVFKDHLGETPITYRHHQAARVSPSRFAEDFPGVLTH